MNRLAVVCAIVLIASSTVAQAGLGSLKHLSTHVSTDGGTPVFDEGLVEISAYDPGSKRVFLTNGFDNELTILDITDPKNPVAQSPISLPGGPNSVAIAPNAGPTGLIAVAIGGAAVTDNGTVEFYNLNDLSFNTSVNVGPLPDMVAFTPNGSKLLVANEGEALEEDDGDPLTNNPDGSISFIDINNSFSHTQVGFGGFGLAKGADPKTNVRINPNVTTYEEDLEPEYITITPDGSTAFVALQENNALAELDVDAMTVTDIHPLGVKDHSLAGNGLDAAKDDDVAVIQPEPLFGMFMPDGIAAYNVGGVDYIVTANEGDDRDDDFGGFDDYRDEDEIGGGGDISLDKTAFPDPFEDRLDDLRVSHHDGDTDNDGDHEELFTYGGRSFSIFDTDGNLVFDSGDQFEQKINELFPDNFNAGDDDFDLDDRSDNSGPEPEGVALGVVDGRTLAFIGIEKMGGVMIYDVTDPFNVSFLDYLNDRRFEEDLLDTLEDFGGASASEQADLLAAMEAGEFDIAPEGLLFIPAADSPNGADLLILANEGSSTTSIYRVVPEPTTFGLVALGGLAILGRRRRA